MARKKLPPGGHQAAGEKDAGVSAPSQFDYIISLERAQIYRGDGKMLGGVVGSVLRKSVDASRHFLRRPPAIAFDRAVLLEAQSLGVEILLVVDRETGQHYRAPLALMWRRGFSLDRGHGPQVALPLEMWTVDGDDHAPQSTDEAQTTQPLLFDLTPLARS